MKILKTHIQKLQRPMSFFVLALIFSGCGNSTTSNASSDDSYSRNPAVSEICNSVIAVNFLSKLSAEHQLLGLQEKCRAADHCFDAMEAMTKKYHVSLSRQEALLVYDRLLSLTEQ